MTIDRPLPRPFAFPFGQGQVVDEVSVDSQWHQPTLQLLEWDDQDLSLRFCSYTHAGRFQRNPLVVSANDLAAFGSAVAAHERIAELLRLLTPE
jgi:hypothetical protein